MVLWPFILSPLLIIEYENVGISSVLVSLFHNFPSETSCVKISRILTNNLIAFCFRAAYRHAMFIRRRVDGDVLGD